jgi:dethiobiotin synthetase
MTVLFVTASGTDVGKTFVMVRLIEELRAAGHRVRALKPVASGFDAANAGASDTGALLRAMQLPLDAAHLDAVSPWRFAAPLSPDMAAARERRCVPFDALVDFCRGANDVDITLVEGIGGVMVPLDDRHTVVDWLVALGAPVLLVVGSYLGTLSHGLTAASVLRGRGAEIAGVVVSESPQQPAPIEETAAVLARFLPQTPVRVLARNAPAEWMPLLPLLTPYLAAK